MMVGITAKAFAELARFAARMVATVLGAAFLVIVAIEISIPGGFRAVMLPTGANPNSARDQSLIETFHLDDNVIERYVRWIGNAVQGDFGVSARNGISVTELMVPRIPISIELMLVAVVGTVLIGIPLGLLAAVWSGRPAGGLVSAFLGVAQTVPAFISSLFLIWLFALKLQWLPAAGWTRPSNSITGNLETLVLPALTLILAELGAVGRLIRADTLIVLQNDYITAALGKGIGTRAVLLRHALRPASLGLLNVLAITIGTLLSGTIVVELVFGIGGLGQLVLRATTDRDLYLLLGLTTYMAIVYVTLNSIVDATMRVLDPRITLERRRTRLFERERVNHDATIGEA